ncbi:MAG: hypothetical protein ACP5N1_01200 [Candidatus Woesearchaeota archaeon]
MNNKPWLERQFINEDIFLINVNYILEHLTFEDVVKTSTSSDYWKKKGNIQATNFLLWQEGKEARVEKVIKELENPLKIHPIKIAVHPTLELYTVMDGISRLRTFHKNNIEKIYTRMYRGYDFSYAPEHIFFYL